MKSELTTRIDLPGAFCVWLSASKDAEFLRGRFVWSNWDVDELIQRKKDIIDRDLLKLGLKGWPTD